jgi:hypothetical protein
VLLELHATEFVRYNVAPVDVVPIAMNWVVWFTAETACELGMTAIETTAPPVPPPPVPPLVEPTVIVAADVTAPLNPDAVAVTVDVPAPTPVTTPLASTVATDGVFDDHVTPLEMGLVER